MSDLEIERYVEDMFGMGNDGGLGSLDAEELLSLQGDLGALVMRHAPGLPASAHASLVKALGNRVGASNTLMANAAASFFAKQAVKPNAAATIAPALTGGAHTAVASGAITPLVDIATGLPFQFQEGMVFYSLETDSEDVAKGFYFAANTVKFASDIAPSMQSHVAFSSFAEDNFDPDRVPLGVYRGRRFRVQTQFNASVVQFSAAPQTMAQGVTIMYYDARIRNACGCFAEQPNPATHFNPIVNRLLDLARGRSIGSSIGSFAAPPLALLR